MRSPIDTTTLKEAWKHNFFMSRWQIERIENIEWVAMLPKSLIVKHVSCLSSQMQWHNCWAKNAHLLRWPDPLYSASTVFVLCDFFFLFLLSSLHRCPLSFRRPNRKVSHGKINGPFPFVFCLQFDKTDYTVESTTWWCDDGDGDEVESSFDVRKKSKRTKCRRQLNGTYVKIHILCVRSRFTYHIISMRCSLHVHFVRFVSGFCVCCWFSNLDARLEKKEKKNVFFLCSFCHLLLC